MRSDAHLIDLGDIELNATGSTARGDVDSESDRANPPTTGGRTRRARLSPFDPTRARLWHWWPLVLLSVALLAGTAAAAPAPHGLAPAFRLPVDRSTSVALTDRSLYVVTGTPVSAVVSDPEFTLSAYTLRNGEPLWSVELDVQDRPSSVAVHVVDGVPLVTGWRTHSLEARPDVDMDGRTTAYEPATGHPRWTRPGFLVAHQRGAVVLEQIDYFGAPPVAVGYHVTGVDLATGDIRWRHDLLIGSQTPARDRQELPVTDIWTLSDDGRHLATLRRDGQLVVRDLPAGRQSVKELGRPWHDASLAIGDGLLRVSTLLDRERTLAVYDLYPLAERWRLSGMSATTTLDPCGPVLCLRTRDRLQGVDPATGVFRWTAEADWDLSTRLASPWPHGLVQVTRTADRDDEAEGVPAAAVMDAATGTPALALDGWRSYPGPHGHPYPIVVQRGASEHQPGHPEYDPGPLWLGRVDPGMTKVEVLGMLDRVRDCQVGERYVACVGTTQQVTVWRIR